MIFAARYLQEKRSEQHFGMYLAFVHLLKPFDRLPRELLCRILRRFGCPDMMVALRPGFHDGMKVRVSTSGDLSDEIEVIIGVQ